MDKEKEKKAIQYLKSFEPQSEPYYLCYSGGKDSDAIKILAELAGVNFEAHHNLTTADAPETVRYVKSQSDIIIERPRRTMWQLIVDNMFPPIPKIRYCCKELKERGGQGHVKITGVRWFESTRRATNNGIVNVIGKPKTMQKKAIEFDVNFNISKHRSLILNDDNDKSRRFVEHCYRTTSTAINPIVDWTDNDVWEFLKHYGCGSNPLYQCGFDRVGCIGCPRAGHKRMKRDFERYPKYRANYVRAFDRMLQARKEHGKRPLDKMENGESVMQWWVGDLKK